MQCTAVASSFRDPDGRLFSFAGRLLRFVKTSAASDTRAFLASKTAQRFLDVKSIVPSEILASEELDVAIVQAATGEFEQGWMVLEHKSVSFQSFPYEWPAEMLHAAALLTLDLAREALKEGFGLKDATPYNVLFEGPRPVFVDLLSFERRRPDDAIWKPYAQFVNTFVLPLLLHRHYRFSLDRLFLASREGVAPEEVYPCLTFIDKIRPPFLTMVSIPTWLGAQQNLDNVSIYRARPETSAHKARFILNALLHRLGRTLRRLEPHEDQSSRWSGYSEMNSYSPEAAAAKHAFLETVLSDLKPKTVLDVGSNQGRYSEMAARLGAKVVAIDSDPVVTGALWQRACAQRLDILPLVINFAWPSPAIGWRNCECRSFIDRAREKFECVLMLAVMHHLEVTDRIPLSEILDLVAELTTGWVVIEFVPRDDAMFKRLTRGREALHEGLNVASFENSCQENFQIIQSLGLPGSGRRLYLLRRKNAC